LNGQTYTVNDVFVVITITGKSMQLNWLRLFSVWPVLSFSSAIYCLGESDDVVHREK